MTETWKETLNCAIECDRCRSALGAADPRILSVYDHRPICAACKKTEEAREDYAEASQKMIGRCMMDTELHQGDPGGYCYHHFYPYTCTGG